MGGNEAPWRLLLTEPGLGAAFIQRCDSRSSHGLGSWWRGHEGSQGAGGGGEVAERPPWRTPQLAAAVISAAGSRRGRAPKGFGRSPNPRRQRGRSGRREGWWHLPHPAATTGHRAGVPGAAAGKELLPSLPLGRVPTAIPAGTGAGGDTPVLASRGEEETRKQRGFLPLPKGFRDFFCSETKPKVGEMGHKQGLSGKL